MKRIIVLILIIIPVYSFSQKGYCDGYIIDYCNDTIYGRIKDSRQPFSEKKFNKIRFIDSNGKRNRFSPYKISEYSKCGSYKFRSIDLDTRYFAEVIVDGPVSLLKNVTVNYESYGNFNSVYYLQRKGSRTLTKVRMMFFKKSMSNYFSDFIELRILIENKTLTYSDINQIVNKYNEWKLNKNNE